MRILLVNQFVPPEEAPTARLLGDLERHLTHQGHEVRCIGAARDYRKAATGILARLIRDLRAHVVLAWKILMAGPSDWLVCLSDPPGLPFTIAILAKLTGARSAHWAMDVYPDVAEALGALPKGGVAHAIRMAMRIGYDSCDLLAALDVDMAARIEPSDPSSVHVCAPWPPSLPRETESSRAFAGIRRENPNARIWLYSGNLGRAHEYEILLRAQAALEEQGSSWHLVFQGGGVARDPAQALAAELGLTRCHWVHYADDRELVSTLANADLLIATQKESMLGLIWPSKLAMMTLVERPIAWVGPAGGAIATWLESLTMGHGIFTPDNPNTLAEWIRGLPPLQGQVDLAVVRERIETIREQGLDRWSLWLGTTHSNSALIASRTPAKRASS